ncbi:MAG: ribonuclease Y [bacterium]
MIIVAALAGLVIGAGAALLIKNFLLHQRIETSKLEANRILADARKEAENLKREKSLEARDEAIAHKQQKDKEIDRRFDELRRFENQLRDQEVNIDKKLDRARQQERELRELEKNLKHQTESIAGKEEKLDRLVKQNQELLERTAGMSAEEALEQLKNSLVDKARAQTATMLKEMRDNARLEANREAKELIIQAIQRSAADHTAENTVSVVNLPNDDVKGRIIGREGRNIRALEQATGVDFIVDDTPEAVILSSFDPYRREAARIALEKLVMDGRIHPGRIEEVVEKAKKELDERVLELGRNALIEAKVHGVHPELSRYLGRLHYRTSYGQNVLKHAIEVSHITGLLAIELGLDAKLARRAGLLHDIGKAIDREAEGTHVQLGMDLAQKYNEPPVVINAIGSHHEDVPADNPISVLVAAADAISGSRPGARRETLESYIQRLHSLEEIAEKFEGVNKVFAIQAGREVRVIVENEKINDDLADALAHDIAEKIEQELEYPGQIKVTVIREYRSVEYAK